jgi:hypothetical protein
LTIKNEEQLEKDLFQNIAMVRLRNMHWMDMKGFGRGRVVPAGPAVAEG